LIVVDTSAWVEMLRGTDSRADRALQRWLAEDEELAVTEVVIMEILAGARPGEDVSVLRAQFEEFPILPLQGVADYEAAAKLYRDCRVAGETVRELNDCLVAVPAIRAGAPVLHADTDFDKLARHTPLEVVPLHV
jgi:predicted nucleic acid-binding protein